MIYWSCFIEHSTFATIKYQAYIFKHIRLYKDKFSKLFVQPQAKKVHIHHIITFSSLLYLKSSPKKTQVNEATLVEQVCHPSHLIPYNCRNSVKLRTLGSVGMSPRSIAWPTALALLQNADVLGRSAAISACGRANQWQRAVVTRMND